MKLNIINAGHFRLDGGSMFGIVPKSIWGKACPSDIDNRIELAANCLLIQTDDRNIIIDTGLGNKQNEKFFGHYNWDKNSLGLEKGLWNNGLTPNDITDVFHTHLHFDHCGGAIKRDENDSLIPTFPNATYWLSKKHLEWALNPNDKEKGSFLKENISPISTLDSLKFVEEGHDLPFEIITVNGHTESQILPLINCNGHKLIFAADLLPTTSHIPMPYVMSYDINPLLTIEEKKKWFETALIEECIFILGHDPYSECCTLRIENGKYKMNDAGKIKDFI
ncbi:MBL fold metallo-hydrolase [Aureibacter tunicatorum]|uniref:Glyoxylase-like metal-dependent hydrolase (Beta-lactamase superfamily II) n=1 Tax=Aureibacter tunicatorum TaxID=866807 RepID=A0AAE4BSS2_9BACT|nr:MBL fold metallo-hydrolase [Aureibacter tunicatorum]MDR6239170.1 glyoxylase-like metal-dependent hydrolase (beta-lactamase superfamily II) [Aureibacter tunicatorum]BDD04904.1 MBL fold metallo-hydrolase [Aureibacter tunicatorum]